MDQRFSTYSHKQTANIAVGLLLISSLVFICVQAEPQHHQNTIYSLRNNEYFQSSDPNPQSRFFFTIPNPLQSLQGLFQPLTSFTSSFLTSLNPFGSLTGQTSAISNPFSTLASSFTPIQDIQSLKNQVTCTTILTGGTTVGVCQPYLFCKLGLGLVIGKCSAGLRACCLSKDNSATSTSRVMGNFVKSSPTATNGTFTVRRASNQFCQVRVDFNTFELDNPNIESQCVDGRWMATGQADTNVPILCGSNTGQSVYLNFDSAGTPITMNIQTSLLSSNWDLKTTQIACDDELNRAPAGCLQYFTASSGTIQSFNYRDVADTANDVTFHLANQNYKICLGRPTSTATTLTLRKPVTATDLFFTMSGSVPVAGVGLGNVFGAVVDADCLEDYIGVPGATYTDFNDAMATGSKFCGTGFPTSLTQTSATKPFMVMVVTNGDETTGVPVDIGNVGFSLSYLLT